jgi:hypothetical protein
MRKKSANGSRRTDADLNVPPVTRSELRRGVMGKYATQGNGAASRFIELDRDVAREFRDGRSVNEALRMVLKLRTIGVGTGKRKKTA